MHAALRIGCLPYLGSVRERGKSVSEEFNGVCVSALGAVFVSETGVWVGEFGARACGDDCGGPGAAAVVAVWAWVEEEESVCGGGLRGGRVRREGGMRRRGWGRTERRGSSVNGWDNLNVTAIV